MVKRLDINTLDEKTQEFLKSIQVEKEQYLLESNGKPFLGVVSPDEVERVERFKVLDRMWGKNTGVKENEVQRDVAEALKVTSNRIL